MKILSPPISIYSNVLIAFALQLSLINKDVFVRSEFTKIAATVPKNNNFTSLYLDYLDQLVQWDNATEMNACNPGSFTLLPTGTFKTMKYTIEPVEAGEDVSILTDPADLIVSADIYNDPNGVQIDAMLSFVYNFDAIANADEVGIWIKFPADKLEAVNVERSGLSTNGMTTSIVKVKEGFSNLNSVIAFPGTYIQASVNASELFVYLIQSTGIFDIFDVDDSTAIFYASDNSTLVTKGGDIHSIECGDGIYENDFSKCIVDGYVTNRTEFSAFSVEQNSSLITKDCTSIGVQDTGTCTEENNIAAAIDDLLTDEQLDTSHSTTTNSTFSFCSPPLISPSSSSSSSSFPLKIGLWGNSFLALTVALFFV